MRPIDADVYENEIWKLRRNYQLMDDTHTADKIMHGLYRAEQALKEAPTLEVRPVVHGHWIENTHTSGTTTGGYTIWHDYTCSVCGGIMGRKDDAYCYKCGAIMDEKEEE